MVQVLRTVTIRIHTYIHTHTDTHTYIHKFHGSMRHKSQIHKITVSNTTNILQQYYKSPLHIQSSSRGRPKHVEPYM